MQGLSPAITPVTWSPFPRLLINKEVQLRQQLNSEEAAICNGGDELLYCIARRLKESQQSPHCQNLL